MRENKKRQKNRGKWLHKTLRNTLQSKIYIGLMIMSMSILAYLVLAGNFTGTRIEWFNDAQTSDWRVYDTIYLVQQFTIGTTGTNSNYELDGIQLLLSKYGSPASGLCYFNITKTDTAGTLANGSIDPSTLGSQQWYNITMRKTSDNSQASLLASTQYNITASCPSYVDTDNMLWYSVTAGGYAGGTGYYNGNQDKGDFEFEVWGSGGGIPGININILNPEDGTIISAIETNFTATFNISESTFRNYTWRNATYYVWEDGLFNKTSVELEQVNNTNYTLAIDAFTVGNYEWNIWGCYGNTTFRNCTFASSYNYSLVVGAGLNSITYTANTFETARETFTANFSLLPNSQISSIYINYNGTSYPVTNFTTSVNNIILSKTIDIPLNLNPYSNTTKEFYFQFTYGGGSVQNTSSLQQNVSFINLQICNATYSTVALNFTMKNETLPLNRVNTFIFNNNFRYYLGSGSVNKTLAISNLSVSSEINICLYPTYKSYTADADIDYSADGFSQRSYYLRKANITNTANHITLYSLTNILSKSIIAKVQNQYLIPQKNHFVNILRYYPGLGVYYLVEIAKTDDFGNAIVKVEEEDADYRVQIQNSTGTVVYSSNPMKMVCTTTPCQLEFIIGETEHISKTIVDINQISYDLYYDNNTGYIVFEYADSSGLTHSMQLIVDNIKNYGTVNICNTEITGSAGIGTCYIENTTTGEVLAKVYRSASDPSYFASISIFFNNTWRTFGTEGLVWMLLFVMTMFFIGLTVSPAIAGIMTIAGFIFMMATGIAYIPFFVLFSIIVVVIIFIIKMRS